MPSTRASTLDTIEVRTRFDGGTYTVRSRGKSASCSWSASEAVRRLAKKLGYKPGFDVALQAQDADGAAVWRIVAIGQRTRKGGRR